MLAIIDSVPPAMLAVFNFSAFNLTTVTGFLGVMFTYFSLIISVSAVMWGSDIITKEERDKTVEFSLTLPVRRSTLITAKTLAALVNCLGLLLFTGIAIVINAATYEPDSEFYSFLSMMLLAFFLLQMIFLAIGIFLGCAMKHYKQASSVAVGVLLGTFMLSVFAGLNEDLDFLKYATPFKYFNPVKLFHESSIEPVFLVLTAVIIVVCLAGAYFTYAKRDLYI